MHFMNIIVIAFATLAALAKLVDVLSTIKVVKTCDVERNPIGRAFFRRFGVTAGCWITFAIQVLICVLVGWEAVFYSGTIEKVVVIAIYGVLTYFNASTGFHNMMGYGLPFTKSMIRFYGWLARVPRLLYRRYD